MTNPSTRQRRGAFTLIELLVVIAILALLLSILVPSLQQAIQAGKAVKCKTNLKTQGYGVIMYASDNIDWVPPRQFYDANAARFWYWPDFVALYCDPSVKSYVFTSARNNTSVGVQAVDGSQPAECSPVFNCPSYIAKGGLEYGINDCNLWGYNGGPTMPTGDSADGWTKVKLSGYGRLMDYAFIMDVYDSWLFSMYQSDNVNYMASHPVHRDSLNAVMLDGHVTSFNSAFILKYSSWRTYPFVLPQ
jgi:prepilin-type N-terminal cleavage/methylation domain-containing protein/prepilin-type processing-associated H-X9-DG protein